MQRANGIQAILFDLDGTLRHSLPSPNHTFYDNAVKLGVPESLENRRRGIRWIHYYWAQSAEMLEDLQVFGDLSDEFWTHFAYRALSAYDCGHELAQELAPRVQQRMSEQAWQDWIPPDVPPTLQALLERGMPLGVVSNRTNPFHEQLSSWGLQDYFSCSLAAGQVNSWKQEVGIFQHALELLDSLPGQSVYVGDNYYADVVGARAAGLLPVLIDPEGIFPEADCPVIHSVGEILQFLEKY